MLPAFHFPASLERSRHRERLEASLAGLLELQFLRQRQEYLVREALQMAEAGDPPSPPLSADFTDSGFSAFPEPGASNSSLRRHLNGLRRQEIGFFSPLQQLERQVNDLRLEATQTSGGELETDSRPSSGFYELSEGPSPALSDSSASIFAECFSNFQSIACSYPRTGLADARVNYANERPRSFAEPLHLAREDSLSYADSDYVSSVPRSFSATHADSLEALMDSQPKYQCDLISRDGLDLFPYPSPLHAMAVQSPLLRQVLRASSEEKPLSPNSYLRSYNLEADGELFYDSQGELAQSPEAGPSKRLENYIAGLVHKRIYPVRSNKPRTSLSVEPAKGLMRQSSVCQRSMEASSPPSTLCEAAHPGPERRSISNSHSFDGSLPSPKYRSPWNSGREQALAKKSLSVCQPADSFLAARHQQRSPEEAQGAQQNPRKPVRLMANTPPMRPTSLEYHELSYHPAARGSPQESYYQNVYEPDDRPQAFLVARPGSAEAQRLGPEVRDKGSPLHSPEDGGYRMVNAQYIPAQQPYKAHASSQGSKAKGLLLSKGRSVELSPEAAFREKGKASGKKCRFSEEAEPAKRGGRKPSPRRKKTCRSQSENSLLNRPGVACIKYNTVERDEAMATRPHRSRRPPPSGSYRRWRSTAEISQEEAPAATPDPYSGAEGQRRARRYPKPPGAPGPAGSDSEYHEPGAGPGGAEEEEDEEGEMAVGAYAPNCFGDSESSLSEAESPGFSTCSSETDEEGGGLVWPQQVAPQAGGREAGQPKVFVKIKASHALKKKILRFRTGSLKVMTTV